MNNDTFIRAQSNAWRQGVELYIGNKESRTRVSKIEIEQIPADSVIAYDPSFVMANNAAQLLMDDLWDCGLRPTEGTGSAGALKAAERHLEDMRTLVFKKESRV